MIGSKMGAIALPLLFLAGCSFKKMESRPTDDNGAAFEVGSVITQQVESLSHNRANGLPDQKAYHLKTCVIDKPTLQPRAGESFRLRNKGHEQGLTADAGGCVYWIEKIRYQPLAPENFIELKRELVGKDGNVALALAVNPWRDQGNSVMDTRFFRADEIGFIVPEAEVADALLGNRKYSPVDKNRGSNLSVGLNSGVLEQGVTPDELILQHAEFQFKGIWPVRNGGIEAVKLRGGNFVAQFLLVERLRADRKTGAISSPVWVDGTVTEEGRFTLPPTLIKLTAGVGELSTFELWYRIFPHSPASGLEPAVGNILLPDGIKGRLGSLQELNPKLHEPSPVDDEFVRAGGGAYRRDQLGFQLRQPRIDHLNARTVDGDSKNWVRVMRVPIEVCLIDPLKGMTPLVNFPVKVTAGLASQFPDDAEAVDARVKKLKALEPVVNPVDENSVPVTDNRGCLVAEYEHRFNTGAKSKPELVRIDVEGRRLFQGVRRSEYLELILLDSTRPPVYRNVVPKHTRKALEVSKKPKNLSVKQVTATFQKTTYTLEENYRLIAHRHYRVVMSPKIVRTEDSVNESPVEQSAVALRGLVLDGSEVGSSRPLKDRALAAFETHSVVDRNGAAQFNVVLPIPFDSQYLLDRKTVLWFDLRAVGPTEGPEPLAATVEFATGSGDGRASNEAVDSAPRLTFEWDREATGLTEKLPSFKVPQDEGKVSYQLIAPPSESAQGVIARNMADRGLKLEQKKWSDFARPEEPAQYCATLTSDKACEANPAKYLRLVGFSLVDKVKAFALAAPERNPRSDPFFISATILNEIQFVKGDAETDRTAWKSGVDVSSKLGYGMFETGGYVRGYTNWERESGGLHEVRLSQSERKRVSVTNTLQIQEEALEFKFKAEVRDCVLVYPLLAASDGQTARLVCGDPAERELTDSWHYYTEAGKAPQSTLGSPFNLASFAHVVHGAVANAEFKKKIKDEVLANHFVHLKPSGYELDNLKQKVGLTPSPTLSHGVLNSRSLTPFRWHEEDFARAVGKCSRELAKRDNLKVDPKAFCFCVHEPLAQQISYAQFIEKAQAREQPVAEYSGACARRAPPIKKEKP